MKYYENDGKLNGISSRDNLPNKIKHGAYIINLDEYSDIGTHWIALWVNNNNVTYFNSFGVEHIPIEIKTFIKNRNIKTNIFRIQAYDSIMCGYFYIGFIGFMFKGKSLTDYTNLFSPNNFKRSDDTILKYFMNNSTSTSNGKMMILSKCAICGSKKSKFIKKQEAKGILSSLGIKTPLSKIPLLGDVLF